MGNTRIFPGHLRSSGPAPFDPNTVAGLVIDVDSRFVPLPLGAIASVTEQKNGYVFAGAAERGASINGFPTIDFNFANSPNDILTTTAPVTQLAGAKVITVIGAYKDGHGLGSSGMMIGSVVGAVGEFATFKYFSTTVYNYGLGNAGITEYHAPWATAGIPAVITTAVDFNLATGEADFFRKNGVPLVGAVDVNANNSGTFASLALSMGASPPHLYPWLAASIGRALVYATATPLSLADIQYLERGVGALWGITVA